MAKNKILLLFDKIVHEFKVNFCIYIWKNLYFKYTSNTFRYVVLTFIQNASIWLRN